MTDHQPDDCASMAPHCDSLVLHAPGECRWCDERPEWQNYRQLVGIAFTGHEPVNGQVACPSDQERGTGQAHVWGGNRPTNVDVPQTETVLSRIMFGQRDALVTAEWLTLAELAEEIGVTKAAVLDWRKRGKGPVAYKFGNKTVRFRRSDVDAWLATFREEAR